LSSWSSVFITVWEQTPPSPLAWVIELWKPSRVSGLEAGKFSDHQSRTLQCRNVSSDMWLTEVLLTLVSEEMSVLVSTRNGNLKVPVYLSKAKEGCTVRKMEADEWI
jgi:hypothetical protein